MTRGEVDSASASKPGAWLVKRLRAVGSSSRRVKADGAALRSAARKAPSLEGSQLPSMAVAAGSVGCIFSVRRAGEAGGGVTPLLGDSKYSMRPRAGDIAAARSPGDRGAEPNICAATPSAFAGEGATSLASSVLLRALFVRSPRTARPPDASKPSSPAGAGVGGIGAEATSGSLSREPLCSTGGVGILRRIADAPAPEPPRVWATGVWTAARLSC
mmetsp:Transcript_127639/g.369523  ORF Transcript_127639/g.369523 Transcript_127639/m.369523 type:complete len:216 (-) Transcript_127639:1745-2392(-)